MAAAADLWLAEEAALLTAFVAQLEREQLLLTRGESERLAELIGEKEALIRAWQALASRRDAELKARNLPTGRAGIEAWLKAMPAETHQRWQEVLALVARAQTLNRTNGTLIDLHLSHNRQALAALATAESVLTYGPNGATSTPTGGRQLGEA